MSENVFFLGAGFSKSIVGYPILEELSNEIKEMFNKEDTSISRYYKEEIPEKFHDNIEMLLSYLLMDLPYKEDDEKHQDKALYENITKKIAKYFLGRMPNNGIFRSSYIKKFSNYIIGKKCTCITLNYDLLLEFILQDRLFKQGRNINGMLSAFHKIPIGNLKKQGQVDNYKYINSDKIPNIIKLHGSVSWLYSKDINDKIYDGSLKSIYSLQFDHLKTLIVPPVLDKSILYSNTLLKALWKQAFKAIQNAKNIYIYGFSFPETDYSIKFLFQRALKCRDNYKIYVININNNLDELKIKYNNVFNEKHCNYDCCVEEGQLEKLIDIIEKNNKKNYVNSSSL